MADRKPRETRVEAGWAPVEVDVDEGFTWLHVPAATFLRLLVLSGEPTRYYGHWADGRLRPCEKSLCAYCARRIKRQLRYVISVYDLTIGRRGLIELGDLGGAELRRLAIAGGTLRGIAVQLRHEGGRPRGRIQVLELEAGWEHSCSLPGAAEGRLVLPTAQDVGACLAAAWERLELGDPSDRWGER